MTGVRVTMVLPPEVVDEIVGLAAARVLAEMRVIAELVTPAEAAELLRCNRQRIYDLISAGKLSRYGEGGRTLLRRDEVLGLVQLHRKARR